jgi:methyl-accepting chemotaxis protein
MLSKVSVAALLKAVVGLAGLIVVAIVGVNVWESWQRLGEASRVLAIAEVSGHAFKAMHNLRTDRSSTARNLNAAGPIEADAEKYLKQIRAAQMPALNATATLLEAATRKKAVEQHISAVEEQGAATREITRNTQEAARRTKDVSENVAGVAQGADAAGAAAQGVKSAAEALGTQTDRLRAQVNDFLSKIRAA